MQEEQQEQVMQMQHQQQQQQHNNNNNNNIMNMNMNIMSSSSATSNYYANNNNNNLTTHHIQQYLDENKSLILKIVESQNSGKLSECAENQVRLQRNLMYLAAIADSQPQPTMHSQYGQSGMMQPGAHYLQAQQQQAAARSSSSMLYTQQQYSALQQQQAMNSQLGIGGTHFLPSEPNSSHSHSQLFPDLMTPGKQDMDARLGRTSSADDDNN